MSLLLLWIAIFVVSLYVLIKASDYFTESAEKIGLAFGIPDFIIGVTIVAICSFSWDRIEKLTDGRDGYL